MPETWRGWGKRPFQFTTLACVQFVVLTTVAMLLYPGGSRADPTSRGYSFFNNFFSELGLTVTSAGTPKRASLILWVIALTVAGLGMVVFFVAAPQFFWRSRALRVLGVIGSLFGVLSGLSYIGVALTPANLIPLWHGRFTLWSFQLFLVAAVLYSLATILRPEYPRGYALAYVAFSLLLAAYVWLMLNGPGLDTAHGVTIQATGQKIISYAAIVCMFIQSRGASEALAAE